MKGVCNPDTYTKAGVVWVIILNAITFLQILWVIFLGYVREREYLLNLGVMLMFVAIVVRYCSFFKFIDKSLFFLIGGILLFCVGYFMERGRRRIARMFASQRGDTP
jgi:uncharacterized membrane protein